MTRPTPSIGIGLLGTAFMGRAHARGYQGVASMYSPPPLLPRLEVVAGRDEQRRKDFARSFGVRRTTGDWRTLVDDPSVEVFDNSAPNDLHEAPTIAALAMGKHVICEKPLGRTGSEALRIWQAAEHAGVVHMCAFNYRFVPAIRKLKELIAGGALGRPLHFRARYLQDWLTDPSAPATWRLDADQAGSGALGDLGSHIADLGRYLIGEVDEVTGATATFFDERPGGSVTVDDAFVATVRFDNGAIGTLEASRVAHGHVNDLSIEVNGTKGSARFSLERLNELEVDTSGTDGHRGFRRVLVTDRNDTLLDAWWPPGHVLGWEHTFVHELHHFLTSVAAHRSVRPHGADFEDGYRAALICDAVEHSAATGRGAKISLTAATVEGALT
ncbi:putative oxidoreductase [Mycolicibacterium canariasense]|uniref:Putative oxidoreductase n=1 Tax=Mycolicibacterium canariasense TaxID=228230 RepID=A0A100WGS7_MYCCR|nr:Gfo/Idh/MocA family oxidoreductase [Mycolicibacterium canariasense]GAS98317.1 putative oxidoreductase [Mycolicibacterium canariasense]